MIALSRLVRIDEPGTELGIASFQAEVMRSATSRHVVYRPKAKPGKSADLTGTCPKH
jgi:hypothetical protein